MKYSIIIFCVLLTSCFHSQKHDILTLPQETIIKGIDYPNEIFMNYPWSIDIIDNKLLLFATKGEYIMRIVDADSGSEIKQIGTFGGGPREFVQPVYWGYRNNEIYVYDEHRMRLRKYNWYALLESSTLPEIQEISLKGEDKNILFGRILNNGNFVGSVVIGMPKPIITLNAQLNTIENIGNIPDKKHQSTALTTYGGAIDTYNDKFVFAMNSLGYIACYKQQADGSSFLLWEHYLEEPIYKGNQLDMKNLKLAFPDVKMTKNYIFCSYFGERLTREKLKTLKPRNILVFDHQGNLLKNLQSDRSVGKFTVSDDEKTLYAVTEEPEVAIIRFNLETILK